MKFNLPKDLEKFDFHVNKIREHHGLIELTKKQGIRTIDQIKYVHVLFTLYGIEIGLTKEESKTELKRSCSFMRYEKNNSQYLKSVGGLDKKELSDFIEWIRNFAGLKGIYLPSSDDYLRNWADIEQEIDRHKHYI